MLTLVILTVIAFLIGGALSYCFFKYGLKARYDKIIKEAETEAEVIKKNKLLEVKEKFLNKKADLEKEVALRNQKIQQAENKLKQREMVLNQKNEELQRKRNENEAIKENLDAQLVIIEKKKEELDQLQSQEREKLEALSGLSAEEAKERLVESLKEEAKTQAQSYINDIMDDAKLTANREAKRIVIQSIQRVATETAIENSVTVFHIESDEIKGRIIGREGRNIRALEAATGVEIVVDDTPEAIVLSAFDPVRREIARLALHQLVTDGRIHPARIEEVVAKVRKQVEDEIIETGKRTTIDLGIHGLHPELIRIIGKMKYRSSYGQNLLQHARETANLCAVMASELGLNPKKAKRAGLLHDIGKVPDEEPELPHALLGMKLAEKNDLPQVIKDFIRTHHGQGLTKYFYISYQNEHPDEEVDKEAFRYPGPNPFTKEQAILMMADSVEAASRSLKEYTEESISGLVDKIIDSQVQEGYFKECPITFKDIATVKSVFKEKLKTMYHTRISYPELKK